MAAVNDRRTAYKVYPGLVGIQFIFSGLFVKIQSLPGWLHAWTPYISVLRYNLEGNFYNTYGPLKDSFPVLPLNGYSVYQAFIDLFSWGGGTKSYCLQAVIINVFFFKALTLLVSGISCVAQQGGRKFRKNIDYNE